MNQPLHPDDLVAVRSNSSQLGVVERTYGDVDTHEPHPGHEEEGRIRCAKDIPKRAFGKFMKTGVPPEGTVLVRWQHTADPQLIKESKLELIDRSLLIGDVVKRSPQDAMSGVVLNTFTKCTLQPMADISLRDNGMSSNLATLKGLPPPTPISPLYSPLSLNKPAPVLDVPACELKEAESPTPEDLVIYKDWIGRVEETTTFISIKLSDNGVVEIEDHVADHLDGVYDAFNVGDIAITKKGELRTGRWIYGKYNPNTMAVGTVVQTRIVNAEISWLERRIGGEGNEREPPSVLERDELESADFHIYDRTRRPRSDGTNDDSTTGSHSEIDVRLHLRVRFKDLSGACVKYGDSSGKGKVTRIDRKDTLGYDLNVFDVTRFQTDVTVQWQDQSITHERSIDLVPGTAIDDEHDAWPGEIAHLLDLESEPEAPGMKRAKNVGVVQSVDASERMAKLRWCPQASVRYLSDIADVAGGKEIVTRKVDVASGDEEEVSLYDIEAPGELNVRRGDIVLIINPIDELRQLLCDTSGLDWLGEIVDTRLDGLLTVRLGAAVPVRDVNLRREDVIVAIRSDMSDDLGHEAEDWQDELTGVRVGPNGDIEAMDESSEDSMEYAEDVSDFDSIEDEDDEEEEAWYEDENGDPMDTEDVENAEWESESEEDQDVEMEDDAEETPLTSQSASPPDTSRQKSESDPLNNIQDTTHSPPEPYAILATPPPPTHAFATQPSITTPAHTKRAQKEHRILRTPSNLPKGIYVRTWESRLDLLRVLFVGPAETPYVHAPFIIDFYLPPTFPTDPPQAFFHSWNLPDGLGGVGRVNPNLYEDGKICLSLLGTWESGRGSEGWSASRSTLLQVLVSLLGLVLVSEPYFNEAGYEHLVGMEGSKRASGLYSERVFLKARTFLLAAIGGERGTEGLEDVVTWLYEAEHGERLLGRSIEEVEGILLRGKGGGEEGVVMSKGACVSLERILVRLKEL